MTGSAQAIIVLAACPMVSCGTALLFSCVRDHHLAPASRVTGSRLSANRLASVLTFASFFLLLVQVMEFEQEDWGAVGDGIRQF